MSEIPDDCGMLNILVLINLHNVLRFNAYMYREQKK